MLLVFAVVVGAVARRRGATTDGASDNSGSYLNQWAVHIPGGHDVAKRVARELGYINYGQVSICI